MKLSVLRALIIGSFLSASSPVLAICTGDADGDTVCDNVDLCPFTVPGALVDLSGCPLSIPGDYDRDGDVGIEDFMVMSSCASGPATPASAPCLAFGFDFDSDSDIDMEDFATFQSCYRGDDQPADPNCGDHRAYIEGDCLHIEGTAAPSNLALRLRAGVPSVLQVDVDDDGSADFSLNRSGFSCIVVNAGAGDDTVRIDESNGGFTNTEFTTIIGGRGNDTLLGASFAEVFVGGPGMDEVFMGAGDDLFIWNVGDDADLVEGDGGVDTIEINGGEFAEAFTLTANGLRVRMDRIQPAPFYLDIGTCEEFVLNALGGDDSFSATGNLAALIQISVDGGAGNDTILGGNGLDLLIGGDGDDLIDGNQGNDTILLGSGNDTFRWDPGDGSDILEGESGLDVVEFNGSNTGEIFEFLANGARLRFTRNVGNIVLEAAGIEQFDLRALGASDTIIVNSLAGTEVTQINVDLAGTLGGSTGDAQPDNVIINGTSEVDNVSVTGAGTSASVAGLAAQVTVTNAEPANDRITINALGGNDIVEATGLAANVVGLTLNGGAGDDGLTGSAGVDHLLGDMDDDTIIGGAGNDVVFMGAGADRFIWNPGDGTDLVEGEGDVDTVEVNGEEEAEAFTLTANGLRVRMDRIQPAPFNLDIGTCEEFVLNANGGDDSFSATGNLAALIHVTVDGGAGNDTLFGGNGMDLLIGGDGDDLIDGNQGNDSILLGAGNDTFQWDPGDGSDTIEGESGFDVVDFRGSNINEIFEFLAIGARLRFTRNIGNIVLDADGIEQFDLRAVGSSDIATVNSLAGTAVTQVNIDLAGTLGGATGDAQPDQVTVNGTAGPDSIQVTSSGGAVLVAGLSATTRIRHSEAGLDQLTVNGLAGANTIDIDPGVSSMIAVIANP